MTRRKTAPAGKKVTKRRRVFPFSVGICLAAVGGLVWFMQREANDMELEKELRALPGGEAWMNECDSWVKEGAQGEDRAVWVGTVDDLVRTDPEVGAPVLWALKLVGARRIAGDVDRKENSLYVSTRVFDFAERNLDEPLTGHRWLVATYDNDHGQRFLYSALPAPAAVMPQGDVVR